MDKYIYRHGSAYTQLRKCHALIRKLSVELNKLNGYAIDSDDLGSLLSLSRVLDECFNILNLQIDWAESDQPPCEL